MIFVIFYMAVICCIMFLMANIGRYMFFRGGGRQGGVFGMSDKWLDLAEKPSNREIPSLVDEIEKKCSDKISKKVATQIADLVEANMEKRFEALLDAKWISWAKKKGILK